MRYIADILSHSSFARLGSLASDQWGLVTRRQAEKSGLSPATVARLSVPGGLLKRVTHGVYLVAGAPVPEDLALRAAWLQLEPEVPVWERTPKDGVISHRSAASLYRVGDLSADRHEFTLPERRQTRRRDVRLHTRPLSGGDWIELRGLPVTRPSRIASDLLYDHEDPEAVSRIVADSLRGISDYAGTFADSLAPHAARFGLRRGDGRALLRWLLELSDDPDVHKWLEEAEGHDGMTKGLRKAIAAS
jgi:Transcriptional regulator, AbiEi antitoxin